MPVKLPAGIENGLEIYRTQESVNAFLNGNKFEYLELPLQIREPFQAELISDKRAFNCLKCNLRLTDPDEMEKKFVGCRYGLFDSVPDLEGRVLHPDAPLCDELETCEGFDIICKVPDSKNGKLTRKEYIIIIYVGQGLLDKEIASKLNIELSTVRTHLNHIREKLCVNNRIEIAIWAMDLRLI